MAHANVIVGFEPSNLDLKNQLIQNFKISIYCINLPQVGYLPVEFLLDFLPVLPLEKRIKNK